MTASERQRLGQLAESVINGEISEGDFNELRSWLDRSDSARCLYVEHLALDSMLGGLLECDRERGSADDQSGGEPVVASNSKKIVRAWFGEQRSGAMVAVAAMVALAVVLIALVARWREAPLAGTGDGGAGDEFGLPRVDSGERFDVAVGDERTVELASGVAARVRGPALLMINGRNEAELLRGSAGFTVPQGAEGFRVTVPWGSVTDLGTAFDLEIGQSLETAVRVTEGRVRVVSAADGSVEEMAEGSEIWLASSGLRFEEVASTSLSGNGEREKGYRVDAGAPPAVAHWRFSGQAGTWLTEDGQVRLVKGPRPPQHPAFTDANTAAHFDGASALRRSDRGPDSAFDFTNGDEITLEAWVNPDTIADDRNIYIVGKGRTANVAMAAENQNYSLRLRGRQDQACVSFLFRSASSDGGTWAGDFHRWTADRGLLPGSGWHHVAVSYRFGEPASVRGYLDGEAVPGSWDMGGATQRAPVVDDDEIWVGSARGGDPSNSFAGALDEVTIHRAILSSEVIARRVNP